MSELEDIVQNIGRTLLGAAREQSDEWDYVGYSFLTKDGASYEGSGFLFLDGERREFTLRKIGKDLGRWHLCQREMMRAEGDKAWIASRSALRQTDMAFRQHFEFENPERWRISPATMERQFEVLVGDAFEE